MQPRPRCVEDDITLRLLVPGADGVVLDATLRYDPSDPYAVKATFRAGEASVSWMLGRVWFSIALRASIRGSPRVPGAGVGSSTVIKPRSR